MKLSKLFALGTSALLLAACGGGNASSVVPSSEVPNSEPTSLAPASEESKEPAIVSEAESEEPIVISEVESEEPIAESWSLEIYDGEDTREVGLIPNPDKEGTEVMCQGVTLKTTDEVRVKSSDDVRYFDYDHVKAGCLSLVTKNEDSTFSVLEEGAYNMWIVIADEPDADGRIWIAKDVQPSEESTWYFAGEGSPWSKEVNDNWKGWDDEALEMAAGVEEGDIAHIELTLADWDKFKVMCKDSNTWLGYSSVEEMPEGRFQDAGGNIMVSENGGGMFDIRLTSDLKIIIEVVAL